MEQTAIFGVWSGFNALSLVFGKVAFDLQCWRCGLARPNLGARSIGLFSELDWPHTINL